MQSQTKICDSNCPAENINEKCTVNCRKCNILYHLPCFDIIQPREKILVCKNVVFLCDACLDEFDSPISPKRKQKQVDFTPSKSTNQTKLTSNSSGTLSMSAGQRSLSKVSKLSNEKIEQLLSKLSKQMNENTQKLQENTNVVAEMKKSVDTVHTTVSDGAKSMVQQARSGIPSKQTFAKIVAQNIGPQAQEKTHTHTPFTPMRPKLNATAKNDDAKIKIAMKNRALKQGTSVIESHRLGKPVPAIEPRPKIVWKSIYVSRVSPEVSTEQIADHIKTYVPNIDEKTFKVNKLVKKEQSLEKLSFVSFRVACAESHYRQLSDPSFWPAHVMIGEFVERPRKTKLSDFIGDFPTLRGRKHSVTDIEIDHASESESEQMFQPATTTSDTSNKNNETTTLTAQTSSPLNLSIDKSNDDSKNE